MIAVYMLLGLAVVGGLYWALTQFTIRQRRLTAELTRLEQLTAEVSMNAEALLERVDERTERLLALVAVVEARAEAAAAPAPAAPAPAAPAPAAPPPAAPAPAAPAPAAPAPADPVPAAPAPDAPTPAAAGPKKGGRSRKQPNPGADPAPAAPPASAAPPADQPVPAPAAPPADEPAAAPPAASQRYRQLRGAVWALVDQGKDAAAIAQELDLPRGEVLLLINLRAKKVTA